MKDSAFIHSIMTLFLNKKSFNKEHPIMPQSSIGLQTSEFSILIMQMRLLLTNAEREISRSTLDGNSSKSLKLLLEKTGEYSEM